MFSIFFTDTPVRDYATALQGDAKLYGRFFHACLDGGVYLPADLPAMPSSNGVHIEHGALGLTARQTDVLKLLVQGKPNKLICRDLTLSEGTVKVHVSAILKALRVRSRTEAIAVLARRGISADTLAARRMMAGPDAR